MPQTESMITLWQKVTEACPSLHRDVSPCQGLPTIHSSNKSWTLNYPILAFMMNGQLFAEYARVTGMLGIGI